MAVITQPTLPSSTTTEIDSSPPPPPSSTLSSAEIVDQRPTTPIPIESFKIGDPVWFDDGINETLTPGIVHNDCSDSNQIIIVHSTIPGDQTKEYNVQNTPKTIQKRLDFLPNINNQNNGEDGIDDMINLNDLHESALFWNLKKRYERNKIYTFIGDILISLNPYKMFEIYGLNIVKKYQNYNNNYQFFYQQQQQRLSQPPHLFKIGDLAYQKLLKDNQSQSILICGESGSGKTENTKLLLQYFAAINKSPSNIITEQILESIPLLETFGNAKTILNNNASRYCKYIEIYFNNNNGIISGARTIEFLHEKSRIVSHNQNERNFHIFYELLAGLNDLEKEKYGLQTAEKYFYLNQGNCIEIDGKDDSEDFRFLIGAMQVLGFTNEEQDIIFRILSSILHLGNVYFHRKQFRHGQEGVEIGSDAEIQWISHLLHIPIEDLFRILTLKITETRNETIHTPLNIDQALDIRDAISKLLYMSLFTWLVHRINHIVYKSGLSSRRPKIAVLDMFGFENLKENNSFEQLCINYANEMMFNYYIKCIFKLEQAEYMKEKIEWKNIDYPDNQSIINLISKKPIGILSLLEDESNFPKASDNSFLEKCHYNHALNDIYSRARMNTLEFGIKHFESQVWYNVEGFLEKNRNILKIDIVDLLQSTKMPIMNKIFYYSRELTDNGHRQSQQQRIDGRFITMKPRAPTVSARFQESLANLFDTVSQTNPWFIRCVRPNNNREPMKFDDKIVFAQIKQSALLETINVRKDGYPVRMKYTQFVSRYHIFINTSQLPRGTPSKEITRLIIEKYLTNDNNGYRLGFSKIFLKESTETILEKERYRIMIKAVSKIQAYIRGYLARHRYHNMKHSAVHIQRAYRGYIQRRNYQTLKRGMVRLQATFRARQQRKEFEQFRTTLKHEKERKFIENKAKKNNNLSSSTSKQSNGGHSNSTNGGGADDDGNGTFNDQNFHDPELANLMDNLEQWKCIHQYGDIIKQIKAVIPSKQPNKLPNDIDHHSFAKFTNIYFRSQQWQAKQQPIKTPFLQKNSEKDFHESISVFNLILKFQYDQELSGKKEKLLADYIVQKGLTNLNLRDEILCQLCNQTWQNDNIDSCDRAWTLMIYCLSSFSPSPLLYKYLLKYVSDHAPNLIRPILQRLLLTNNHYEQYNCRAYPPSLLEWKAISKNCGTSIEVNMANGDQKLCQIDSWSTAEQVTTELLKSIGFQNNHNGWSIDFEDNFGDIYSLNGDDYILDMISQIELLPQFPSSINYFIGCSSQTRLLMMNGTKNMHIHSAHNPDLINKFNVREIIEQNYENKLPNKQPHHHHHNQHLFLKSNVQRQLNQKLLRSMSGETLLRTDNDDDRIGFGLAVHSKLNERYLKNASSFATFTHLIEEESTATALDQHENEQKLKLSEKSRLNQRYISNLNQKSPISMDMKKSKEFRNNRKNLYTRKGDKQSSSSDKLLKQRSISMQELGLAANSNLNIRYFSRDKLHKTASLTGGSDNDNDDSDSFQNQPVQLHSLMNFREKNSSPVFENGKSSARKNNHQHQRQSQQTKDPLPANRKSPHVIRPDSSTTTTTSSSFESDSSSSCLNDTESQICSDNNNIKQENHKRYKKYSQKQSSSSGLSKSQQFLSSSTTTTNSNRYKETGISAAMSDTSEAPSLASHIRHIGIPSHQSELDQYLDDLFNPVLDAQLDDAMSDARSLAQSIKGGANEVEQHQNSTRISLPTQIDHSQTDNTNNLSNSQLQLNTIASLNGQIVDPNILQQQVIQQQMYQMQQRAFLASSLQQNLEIQKQLLQQNQQLQQLLAQTVSSPSTPSLNGQDPLLMPRSTSMSSLAYPLSSLSPIFPMQAQSTTDLPNASNNNNMMRQDRAKSEKPSSSSNVKSLINNDLNIKQTSSSTNGTSIKILPIPPPPPPPPASPGTDVFGRAKTVRIGKWRWPPPSEQNQQSGSNFIEFKRKKQIEKQCNNNDNNNNGKNERSSSESNDIIRSNESEHSNQNDNNNGSQNNNINNQQQMKNVIMGVNKTSSQNNNNNNENKQNSNNKITSEQNLVQKELVTRKYSDNQQQQQQQIPGSIGKLRISVEMRAKLEQLTIDQSVRSSRKDNKKGVIQSQSMDDLANMVSVKKLSEQRKALLERQLMGSLRNNNGPQTSFMETTSTPNIKQSVDNIVGLHTNNNNNVVIDPQQPSLPLSTQNCQQQQQTSDNVSLVSSNYESSNVKKFIKNHQNPHRHSPNQLLRKSGSREFRERREELGPFNRFSTGSQQSSSIDRPMFTPDRYFKDDFHSEDGCIGGGGGGGRHSSTSTERHSYGHHHHLSPKRNSSMQPNHPPPPPSLDIQSDGHMINGHRDNHHHSSTNSLISADKKHRQPQPGGFSYTAMDTPDGDIIGGHQSSSIQRTSAEKNNHFDSSTLTRDDHEKKIKTKLFLKNEINFYAYSKCKFRLKMRKEMFTPSETIENPILLDLIFWQIVNDVYQTNCIRLNDNECQQLQKLLKSEGIHSYNPNVYSAKQQFKRSVIECAKEFPSYFCRLYSVNGGKTLSNVDYFGISHSSVYLFKREKNSTININSKHDDYLSIVEKFSYDDIQEILIPNNCTFQIFLNNTDQWITLYSNKALQIRNILEKFINEYQQTNVEFVRAIKDCQNHQEPSMLSFRKDMIIRVVRNKHLQLAKGWAFGVLEFGESGLFQLSNVIPLTQQQIQTYQLSRNYQQQYHQMDEDSFRNNVHNRLSSLDSTMINGNGIGNGNGHHHFNGSKEDGHSSMNTATTTTMMMNGGGYNNHHNELNSLWIEHRADQFDEENVGNIKNGGVINGNGDSTPNMGTISLNGDTNGNFSLLQFALFNFRESLNKYDLRGHLKDNNNSIRGSIKLIENLKSKRNSKIKNKNGTDSTNDWTWSEFANLVKYSKTPIQSSLLMLPNELNKVSVECFSAIMRYMGDLPMLKNQNEVDCVYTILLNCHRYPPIRDEVYCQLMKQTTSNKSPKLDSCQRGWRLFSIIAAYFDCSETLRPYLFKYLETAAYDKRRAFHVTANITLKNLKKTFKFGGRKNVPSIEEIAAISAGRTSKRQMYRLPGGTERILSTSCTTVVNDIIEEICLMLNVTNSLEMEEFSLYCIIEGDPYTMPLNRDEYILDVTTELLKNGQLFYLIFCRSVWYYPLRLDSHLYIEVVFNQVAPDYLEGLLIQIPDEKLSDDFVQQIARIASLLHRAAELEQMPTKDEIKYLLPKPVLALRIIKPIQWVEMVQNHWNDMSALSPIEAKAQCLDILQKWPLFGSCFFAVKRIQNDFHTHLDHILALNKDGVHFLDMSTHEKVWHHPFAEVISTRKVRSEDGTLYLDMKCGNLMVQKITRIQTDQAHEISRLISQYIEIEQHFKNGRSSSQQQQMNGKIEEDQSLSDQST
ncbi:hypothetical protein DERP_005271 [Dermatophagoides pteronyssinus]|uniref:Unconventional myosin-XV-like n=1 Tax=Dermatophagoides pteronyssinus TaxID=6956 RepID=A0ABQ8JMM5_DERPT|nr:hypothetical protein DERP_005271 [Dermatophagoides pteronyssinus]